MLTVTYPCRTKNPKSREHWRKTWKRTKAQRRQALHHLIVEMGENMNAARLVQIRAEKFGAVVRLTRIAPRQVDDDNLRFYLSPTRDGVADWLGIDDGDERLTWLYAQERGEPKQYAVRIEVWSRDEWEREAAE